MQTSSTVVSYVFCMCSLGDTVLEACSTEASWVLSTGTWEDDREVRV